MDSIINGTNYTEPEKSLVRIGVDVLPAIPKGLCGSIYTQVSDVEDEINGLVTYDRKVEKMDPEKLLTVADALRQAVLK